MSLCPTDGEAPSGGELRFQENFRLNVACFVVQPHKSTTKTGSICERHKTEKKAFPNTASREVDAEVFINRRTRGILTFCRNRL